MLNSSAQQQRVVFEHYTADNVMNSKLVRGMMQDRQGYLWFGTVNAIHRFDGFNFKSFSYETRNKDIFNKAFVNVIYEDKKGDLWIGSQGALHKFIKETGEIIEFFLKDTSATLFKFDIQFVYEDSLNNLWFGTMMGLFNLDINTHKLVPFVSFKYKDLISNKAFRSYSIDNSGNIWFGTGIGLLKFDKYINDIVPIWLDPNATVLNTKPWNSVDYAIQSICNDRNGILWAGSLGGKLIRYNTNTEETIIHSLKDTVNLEKFPIQSICEEDENKLWLATYSGLLLVDKNTGVILERYVQNNNLKESINDNKLTALMKDKSGSLWIGSLSGGINKLNRTKIPFRNLLRESWTADRTYSQVPFSDMIISKNGSLLAGTANGIEEIKPGFNQVVIHDPKSAINTIMEDKKGNLWIAKKQYAGGGLYKKNNVGTLTHITDESGMQIIREIQCLYETTSGRIFFSTDFYLYEVDLKNNKAINLNKLNRRISKICEDTDDILCIGTLEGGLIFFDPDKKIISKHFLNEPGDSSSISDNSISEIYLDSKRNLWIGTIAGLNKFNREKGTFTLYNHSQGLAYNLIYRILENNGDLWLGTGIGISKFNPEKEIFKNYDVSNGLLEGPYYIGSKSNNGLMIFKTRTGITYFYPDSVKDNSYIPPVVISELKVLNNPYPFSEAIELSYSENYISLEFAALSYVSPEKNMFSYKMEGVDNDWVYAGNRRYASYTSLEPGEYIFHVKGSNNDGLWNNEGTSVRITILPPWYKTFWAYTLYIIMLTGLINGLRKYDLKRQNLKYQLQHEQENVRKETELSKMKSRFFTNISHEFRTPLTLIVGPAEKIINNTKEKETEKYAQLMKKNAIHLLSLVNQLLDISRLDEGKMKIRVSFANLVTILRGISMIFESHAESKDIMLKVRAEKDVIEGYFDKDKIEKVLINIISNALKFTPDSGIINISISETTDQRAIIKIRDNGIGIKEEELPKLFDRFYQVDSSHTREHGGTGIGLALTKELVDLHKGKILVNSVFGEWTEFVIELPLRKENYIKEDFSEELLDTTDLLKISEQIDAELNNVDLNGNTTTLKKSDENGSGTKPIILVVEDNVDVRQYISESLEKDYHVEEAVNGEQGYRKAEALIPDLIISDIMMPKMDGYEMTHKIKNDEKTNHIPVILLTAKTDHNSRIEGLEERADEYITKPFDVNELKLRIRNLIQLRKELQIKYSRGETVRNSSDKKLNDLNSKFMNKVNEVIENNMPNMDFSIEDFSHELCMSRIQLHRKLKALTGKSASRYLRSYRLSAAKKMIQENSGNISEVSYNVGFGSPVYFTKCFKEEFGYTPSEFIGKQENIL